jgi:hypothetical protein
MLILVHVGSIAEEGVLGYAGLCFASLSGTAVIGFLTIDTDAVPSLISTGTLDDVILHEIGHALGYGILWSYHDFDCGPVLPSTPTVTLDTYFSCDNARAEFNAVGGASYTGNKVPLENVGQEGSINSHWREAVFINELMTPSIAVEVGTTSPLSVVTVGSFEDIGHVVNYAAADPYTLVSENRGGACVGGACRHTARRESKKCAFAYPPATPPPYTITILTPYSSADSPGCCHSCCRARRRSQGRPGHRPVQRHQADAYLRCRKGGRRPPPDVAHV